MKSHTILLTVLALGMGSAVADTRLTYSTSAGTSPEIAIKGDRIRMEGGDARGITLFDAGSREMTVIDPSARNYYRMDAESVKRTGRMMSEQMRKAREQMEKQLENMPEEQREMMRKQLEKMMPKQAAAEQAGELGFERTGKSASVAGIECELAMVHRDRQPVQRVCIAPAGSLGMSNSDRDTLHSLFAFLEEMANSFSAGSMGANMPAEMMRAFDGVPIRSEDLERGRNWTLKDVQTGGVDESEFRIPSGYTETDPLMTGQ